MPKVHFHPSQKIAEVEPNTKLLLSGRRAGTEIRFGCAACRCGTCAVRILEGTDQLSPFKKDEEQLLARLKLPRDGTIRLACQARVNGDCKVDLSFQDEYSPPEGFDDDE